MAVTRLDIEHHSFERGRAFGSAGRYEELRGAVHIALDPEIQRNRVITDLELAPRAADGRVHFACDLVILRPADASRSNRCLLLDVVNRGRPIALRALGTEWLLRQGYTVVMCGWQHDLPHTPGLIGARLPEALEHGKPVTGLVRSVQQPNEPNGLGAGQ